MIWQSVIAILTTMLVKIYSEIFVKIISNKQIKFWELKYFILVRIEVIKISLKVFFFFFSPLKSIEAIKLHLSQMNELAFCITKIQTDN